MTAKPSPTHPSSGDVMHNLDIYSKCWLLEHLPDIANTAVIDWKTGCVAMLALCYIYLLNWFVYF